jgi:hypothetical protein
MEKSNRLIATRDESNFWGARADQILPSLRGLEVRKYPAAGEVFFLDFPFYRTSQELRLSSENVAVPAVWAYNYFINELNLLK